MEITINLEKMWKRYLDACRAGALNGHDTATRGYTEALRTILEEDFQVYKAQVKQAEIEINMGAASVLEAKMHYEQARDAYSKAKTEYYSQKLPVPNVKQSAYLPGYMESVANAGETETQNPVRKNQTYWAGVRTQAKKFIRENHKIFGGTMESWECAEKCGVSRGSYYKYLRELETETQNLHNPS